MIPSSTMISRQRISRSALTAYQRRLLSGRSPLPPMPRVQPLESPPPTGGSRLVRAWKSGNILIYTAWAGLALFTIDRGLQYLQHRERLDALALQNMLREERLHKRQELLAEHGTKPALYSVVVTKAYPMGGTHGLPNVQVRQVLEVLEEKVGPDQYYLLCRTRDKESGEIQVGWYPMDFVRRRKRFGLW